MTRLHGTHEGTREHERERAAFVASRQRPVRVDAFDLRPGARLAARYVVESKLGAGWEGEVYRVVEEATGVRRAAKLFFPQRNEGGRALTFYAQKLERLRGCPMVLKYIHSERFFHRGAFVACLVSEYVEGELLDRFVARHPRRRLDAFESLHVLHALARGLEDIHRAGEYHGDLHAANVLVRRRGIGFDVKLFDFYRADGPNRDAQRQDIVDLVKLFHLTLGGADHYAKQPPEVKAICRGLRRGLILDAFPAAQVLREHLERFEW